MKVVKNMKLKKQKGFSLIEIILYIGIVSVVLVILVFVFQEMLFLKAKVSNKVQIVDNGQFILNKISYYLQNAESVNEPLPGQSGQRLSLNLIQGSDNPVEFFLENNELKMQKAGQEIQSLTVSNVSLNQLLFTNQGFINQSDIIQIQLNLSNRVNYWQNKPIDLQTSVKLEKND